MSRHWLRLACGDFDIFCASCYVVVKGGEQSSHIALKIPMRYFEKIEIGD